jgi:hypothetical protein
MTITLSERISASSIAWVVSIILDSFFNSYISDQTYLLLFGSIPVVGSSKNKILGFPIPEMHMLSLRFIPPENVFV